MADDLKGRRKRSKGPKSLKERILGSGFFVGDPANRPGPNEPLFTGTAPVGSLAKGGISLIQAARLEGTGKFLGRVFDTTFYKIGGGKVLARRSVHAAGSEGAFSGFRTVNKIKAVSEVPKKIQQAAKKGR